MRSIQLIFPHLVLLLTVPLVSMKTYAKNEVSVKPFKGEIKEEQDRLVDQAAITSQGEAIKRLKQLAARYRNTSQEPVLLAKLAELYQQEGSMKFRIAHGRANRQGLALSLADYKKSMKLSIETLTSLINRYKDYEELDLAYFMRGHAYQEIEDKQNAKKDYLILTKRFPQAPETITAFMALAEYAIDENHHDEAVQYLGQVEKHPKHPQYPFALYKMAWSHYNLKNIQRALGYLERHVGYYRKANVGNDPDGEDTTSDLAILETSLMDIAMFYYEGFDKKLGDYSLEGALPYFRKVETGPFLGKMTVRFAKHLRAGGKNQELIAWKNELMQNELKRAETVEVLMVLFEDQINKRKYADIGTTSKDFVKAYKAYPGARGREAYLKAQRMLLQTAEQIQALTLKNKESDEVRTLSSTLSLLYSSFIDIVNPDDERVPKVHYNLAETLFEIKDYEGATQNYRWVVDNWRNDKTFDLKTASLRAIASRYEVLRNSKLIPGQLSPKPMTQDPTDAMPGPLEEWVQWIDKHEDAYHSKDTAFENFQFEANRAMYAQGKINRSVQRLLAFAESNPQSTFAVPSASLVLDTLVTGADWEKTNLMANRLLRIKSWAASPFEKRLLTLAADSFYKGMEIAHKSGDFERTLKKADECIDQYSKSPRLVDCLLLAGKSALSINQPERADEYFQELIENHAETQPALVALLERAQIREKNFRFAEAAADYKRYMASSAGKKLEEEKSRKIWERTLQLNWLSGNYAELSKLMSILPECKAALAEACGKYKVSLIAHQPTEESFKEAVVKAMDGRKDLRALWAVIGLKNIEKANFKDRLTLLTGLAENWDRLDTLTQFALLPDLSKVVLRAFEYNRKQIGQYATLKPNPKAIKHRVELIQETERVATKIMKLPWARIRAQVLSEIADLYVEFSTQLRSMPVPTSLEEGEKAAYEESIQKIVFPFEEKSSEIRRKAFELASNFGIEQESFDRIAEVFFKESPSQAKELQLIPEYRQTLALDWDLLTRLNTQGFWKKVRSVKLEQVHVTPENRPRILQSYWIKNIEAQNWPAAGYFLSEAQAKADKTLPKSVLDLMRGLTLVYAGARAEGIADLWENRASFEGSEQAALMGYVASVYLSTLGREKARGLAELFEKETSQEVIASVLREGKDAWPIAFAAEWGGARLSEQNRLALLDAATGAGNGEQRSWARSAFEKLKTASKIAAVDEAPTHSKRSPASSKKGRKIQ